MAPAIGSFAKTFYSIVTQGEKGRTEGGNLYIHRLGQVSERK